jgi:hypothetical protein
MPCRHWPLPTASACAATPAAPSGPPGLGAAHQPLRYDALTVALAEQLDVPLLNADARLARAPGLWFVVELAET